MEQTTAAEISVDIFDPDILKNISSRLLSAAYELSQSYENYKSVSTTH